MKKIILLALILVSCSNCQKPEAAAFESFDMRELLKFDMNTAAGRIYTGPDENSATDTLIYFRTDLRKVNVITERHTSMGVNRGIYCSATGLEIDSLQFRMIWTNGPLTGLREVLFPVQKMDGFYNLESRYRNFWIK